jgi:hypothetical protein
MPTTIMPWPMTLAPANEAIGGENHVEKNLSKGKKYRHHPGGHARCKDRITFKSVRFCESRRRKGIEFTILTYIILFIRTILSVLQVLSLSNFVLH